MYQLIKLIPLKNIIIGEYQREPSARRVERIIAQFDPAKLGVLVVNDRLDGNYAIIDGQHRLSALRTIGSSDANCIVLSGLTLEQEADYYRRQSENHANLSNYDLYLAGIVAGDPHFLKLKETLARYGYQAHKQSAPKNVTAVAALTKITELYGFDILDLAFAYIGAAWDGDGTAVRREMLAGIAEFAARFGKTVAPGMFAARMSDKLPGLLYYDYRRRSEGRATYRNAFHPTMRRLCCVVLMEAYNKGLGSQSVKRLRMDEQI
jgi:hypothetical protein